VTLTEEQVTEFRAGTVNDLLLAAKGGTTDSAGEAKRFKSLALAGGVCSAVLALALVVVLLTGTGSKSDTKAASTTGTTLKPLDAPFGTSGTNVTIPENQAAFVKQGGYVTIAGNDRNDGTDIKIQDALVLSVMTVTKPGATKDSPPQITTQAQVAIPNEQLSALGRIEAKSFRVFISNGPTTTTATTSPPATQPATAPPSS